MKNEECEIKVEKELSNLEGVNKAVVDLNGCMADIEVAKEMLRIS